MSDQLRILLTSPSAAYEQRLREAYGGALNGELRRYTEAPDDPAALIRSIAENAPDLVVLGPGLDREAALAVAQHVDRERPEVNVLLVTAPTADLWQRALQAGVRDVLAPDALAADVRAVFDRALENARRRRQNLVGTTDGDRLGGQVITVVSPKGGSGKTTVATNLAVGLALRAPERVALVDLDLQFGDTASALHLAPQHTIVDARSGGDSDPLKLKTLLTPHPSSLYVLCSADSPAEGEEVEAAQAAQVVQTLAAGFDHVVVDTSAGVGEHTLAVLEVSTDIVLLCSMDVSSVRSLRKEVTALDMLGMTAQRRHFVLNRAASRVGLEPADIEATVGLSIDVQVPSSRTVPLSMNQGLALIDSDPKSPVSRRLTELVDRFLPPPDEGGASWLPWKREQR